MSRFNFVLSLPFLIVKFEMPKGVKYILLASFFFSIMNVCVKLLPNIPAHEIVFVRSIVTLIVCYGKIIIPLNSEG